VPEPSPHAGDITPTKPASAVAVLIMAHAQPELLDKLVSRLSESFDVYLHVDKAAPFSPRDFSWASQVTHVPRRRTYWGAFSVTKAIIDLLTLARARGHKHYILISGQDVPLKSNADIYDFVIGNKGKDFIRTIKMPHPGIQGGMERLTRSYWHAFYRYQGVRRFVYQIVEFLAAVGYRTVFQEKILSGDFYHGETWFTLRAETVDAIVAYMASHPEYVDVFTRSRLGEEIFFQTIIRRLRPDGRDIEDTTTFVDWDMGPESPRIFDISDLGRLSARWELFARKVALPKSEELVNELYLRTEK